LFPGLSSVVTRCHSDSKRLTKGSRRLLASLSKNRCVYYETIKRKLNRRLVNECQCDERLKAKAERCTRLLRSRSEKKIMFFCFSSFLGWSNRSSKASSVCGFRSRVLAYTSRVSCTSRVPCMSLVLRVQDANVGRSVEVTPAASNEVPNPNLEAIVSAQRAPKGHGVSENHRRHGYDSKTISSFVLPGSWGDNIKATWGDNITAHCNGKEKQDTNDPGGKGTARKQMPGEECWHVELSPGGLQLPFLSPAAPAQLRSCGDEDLDETDPQHAYIVKMQRTKVLWAKALWWAAQEAIRRKVQRRTMPARDKMSKGSFKEKVAKTHSWLFKSNSIGHLNSTCVHRRSKASETSCGLGSFCATSPPPETGKGAEMKMSATPLQKVVSTISIPLQHAYVALPSPVKVPSLAMVKQHIFYAIAVRRCLLLPSGDVTAQLY
jgi:hypothetical protein